MKFSMNGFRRALSGECEALRDVVLAVIKDDYFDKEELIERVNSIISHSNVLNCVYQDDDPDFKEMADLEVEFISTECNEED